MKLDEAIITKRARRRKSKEIEETLNSSNFMDFEKAYDGSYYTITGAGGDINDWKNGYQELLTKEGIGEVKQWFEFTGADMNDLGRLSNDNAYPEDLTFLAFPLDGLNIDKLSMFKLKMEDRWFDDIIDNNANREGYHPFSSENEPEFAEIEECAEKESIEENKDELTEKSTIGSPRVLTSKNYKGKSIKFKVWDNGEFVFIENGNVTNAGKTSDPDIFVQNIINFGFKEAANESIIDMPEEEPVEDITEEPLEIKESFEDEHGVTPINETPEAGPEAGLASIINKLIVDEWEAIQGYNDAIVSAELENYQDIAKVLRDIVNEENLHVGQLEQCMKQLSPNASSIDEGEVEAETQLNQTTEQVEDPEEGMHY